MLELKLPLASLNLELYVMRLVSGLWWLCVWEESRVGGLLLVVDTTGNEG